MGRVGFSFVLWPYPSPLFLDSGLRRNDEWGAGLTKGCRKWRVRGCRSGLFSYQSLMPVGAGTPRYEKLELWLGTANWHRGFCHSPTRPQRGTSPRTTFPIPAPLDSGLRRNDELGAGLTKGCRESRKRGCRSGLFSYQSLMPAGAGTPGYENWHRPHPSGFRRRIGVRGCFRRTDEVGSVCGRMW